MHWLILTLVALWPITAQAQPQVNCAIALDVQGQWKQNIADIDRRYDELAFINQARQDRTLRVDDPNHTIDFTHIADVTEAIARFAMYIKAAQTHPCLLYTSDAADE